MPTIQDLLDHMSETTSTLDSKGYFNQLKAMKSNAENNLKSNFPAMFSNNPTIDDIINSSLNIAGLGSMKLYHSSDIAKTLDSLQYPFFATRSKRFADSMGKMWSDEPFMHKLKLTGKNNMLDIRDNDSAMLKLLDRANYPYELKNGKFVQGQEELPEIEFMQWPYPETLHDTLYIPKVAEQLRKEGFDGIRYADDSMGKLYDSFAFVKRPNGILDLLNSK